MARREARKTCIVCRRPYYRRNLTINWVQVSNKRWEKTIAKGHPQCLRIFSRVSKMWHASRVS